MKRNKGFTLIELIAIIIIISVILLLGFINITKISDNRKADLYEKLVDIIESAGKDYIDRHSSEADELAVDGTICVKLSTLDAEAFLENGSTLTDPRNDSPIDPDRYVSATKTTEGFVYAFSNSADPTGCTDVK